MTIKERIAKILIDLPFDEELDNDVNAYAMALAEAIENDMVEYRADCTECGGLQSVGCGKCPYRNKCAPHENISYTCPSCPTCMPGGYVPVKGFEVKP